MRFVPFVPDGLRLSSFGNRARDVSEELFRLAPVRSLCVRWVGAVSSTLREDERPEYSLQVL